MIKPGIYTHFKGLEYLVMGTGKHTETGEEYAVYIPLSELEQNNKQDTSFCVRPLEMFTGQIQYQGKTVPRFTYKGPNPCAK